MKTKLFLLGLLFTLQFLYSKTIEDFTTTVIPDANFEQALIDLGIDSDGVVNGQVLTSDINTITSLDLTDPLNNTNLPNVVAKISDLTGIEGFLALETLSIDDNLVSSIDLSFNSSLHTLTCVNNALTALDVSANLLLKTIILDNNQVSVLNVNGNTLLENLSFTLNNVSILNVNNNTALKYLAFGRNQINTIDVSLNPDLETLFCDNNGITSIDVSSNTKLNNLGIQNNQISALDVSANTALVQLFCSFNQLTSLNIANGNNTGLSVFNSTGNAALFCISADATTPINGLTGWAKDMQHIFSSSCAQTYVPDNNLETYLETHDANGNPVAIGDPTSMGNGRPLDDYVFTNRINTVRKLEVPSLAIVLMTGIQDFAALEHLNCFDNNIGTLDLSSNTNLNYVKCDSNQITSLDVTNSPNLNFLACNVNQLPSLDVTQNSNLTILDCDTNQITNIDVTNNPVLHTLDAQGNLLTSLNTSQNPLLFTLVCSRNQIPTIDVTSNTKLNALNCSDNLLTSLNLNLNPDLQILDLSKNSISTIDLSNNLKLEIVAMAENLFTQIDVKLNTALHNFTANDNPNLKNLNIANGNNASFTFLQIVNNPLLTCVIADAATPATGLTGWNKDNQHMFSVACTAQQLTYVPDDNLELYLETHDANGNPVTMGDPTSMGNATSASDSLDDYVFTNRINTVAILRVNGLTISDMTGIEDFVALQVLDAHNNNFSTIDVSSLSSLYQLAIGSNPINMLDVSANSNLRILEVNSTGLINLDVTSNTVLEFLKIDDTSLTSIDTSQNPNLKTLSTENTPLTQVDLTNNTLLEFLELRDNALTGLDISNNLQLISFVLTGSPVTSLDLSQHDKLIEVRVNNNASLAQLNIKNGANTNIATSNFDITNNPNLTCIEVDSVTYSDANWTSIDSQHVFNTSCSSQQITLIPDSNFEQRLIALNIDTDGVVNGQVFTADINTITNLNVNYSGISDLTGIEDFIALEDLQAVDNIITSLDISNLVDLKILYLDGNNLNSLDISQNLKLTILRIRGNQISGVYNTTNNTDLIELWCQNNKITGLDISPNNSLIKLEASDNEITSFTSNVNNERIVLSNNLLTDIDVSSSLNLKFLFLNDNSLKELDLSQNSYLEFLEVMDNELTSLNINNGANQLITPSRRFHIERNPNLECIQVSDLSYANTNWIYKDSQHYFSLDCSSVWTVMTNPATTTALLAVPNLDANNDGKITQAEAAAFTGDANGELNLSGTGITDVEGLAAFTSILKLDVSGNGITDLSPLTGSSFNIIAKSTGKTKIVQKTTTMALQTLIASNNNFDVLDVSSLTNLTTIDVSNNANLVTLNMQNGNNASITSFTASNTPNLTCILVDDVNASYLSTWSKDTKSEFVADATDCRSKVLSLENIDLDTNIVFYPNPVNDILSIKLSEGLNLQEVKVYSLSGKNVMESNKSTLDFSRLSKGFYLVKIITDKGVSGKRIIKN